MDGVRAAATLVLAGYRNWATPQRLAAITNQANADVMTLSEIGPVGNFVCGLRLVDVEAVAVGDCEGAEDALPAVDLAGRFERLGLLSRTVR